MNESRSMKLASCRKTFINNGFKCSWITPVVFRKKCSQSQMFNLKMSIYFWPYSVYSTKLISTCYKESLHKVLVLKSLSLRTSLHPWFNFRCINVTSPCRNVPLCTSDSRGTNINRSQPLVWQLHHFPPSPHSPQPSLWTHWTAFTLPVCPFSTATTLLS